MMRRFGILTGLLVLAADQASKWWILHRIDLPRIHQVVLLPVLNLTMVSNPGITFGLLTGSSPWNALILSALALVVVIALGVWLHSAESRVTAIALGAIGGGAVGNIVDRLRFGSVVDFIDAHIGVWHWYVFNVADAAIVCGVAVLILEGLLRRGRS
jgi:signal peptidase II